MTSIATAILAIKSDAKVCVTADDINQIIWYDDNPTNITNQQILDKQAELQVEYDAKQYQRDRRFKYPSWQDQMDMMWHDKEDDTTTWQDAVAKVKSDNPKP